MFRPKGKILIDRAHNAIACAEMAIAHSFTESDKAKHGAELAQAQRFLKRATITWNEWQAKEDDDDNAVYPDVPETDNGLCQ